MHKFADDNKAAVGKKGFSNILMRINKNNVISVIQNYDNLYNNDEIKNSTFKDAESIVETILDETGSKEAAIREALIGEGSIKGIFTLLLEKAKDAGVDSNAIAKYKAEFTEELNKELKGSRFTRSSAKLDEIIQVVIQAIDNQKILTPTEKKVAVVAVNTKQIDTINIIVNRYNKALKDFNAQMKRDGWTGDVADHLSKIWGSGNTADKVRKDLKVAKKQIDELKAARDKGKAAFEAKFKEIFGVTYNAQNVMAYEKQEKIYLEAAKQQAIENNFRNNFKLLLNNDVLKEEGENRYNPGTDEYEYKTTATKQQVYNREFKKLAKNIGDNGETILNGIITAAGAKTLNDKYNVLKDVAKYIADNLTKNTLKACGGRKFTEVEKAYNNSYKAAYGLHNDILKRVVDYNISQEKGAGIVKGAIIAIATIAAGMATGGSGAVVAALVSGATATGVTAAAEISDRASSDKAIKAAKKDGLKGLLKAINEDVDWGQLTKTSLVNGAMAIAFMGQNYAVSGLVKVGASALGMSEIATAYTTVAATTLSGIALPVGTEYVLTGKISVEGASFAVILAVVAGAIQVVKISQLAASAKAAKTEGEALIQNARETLGIPDDVELTPDVIKQYYRAKAKAVHPDLGNPASSNLEMAIVSSARDILNNALKSGTAGAAKPTTPTAQSSDEMGLVPADKALTVVPDAVQASMPATVMSKYVQYSDTQLIAEYNARFNNGDNNSDLTIIRSELTKRGYVPDEEGYYIYLQKPDLSGTQTAKDATLPVQIEGKAPTQTASNTQSGIKPKASANIAELTYSPEGMQPSKQVKTTLEFARKMEPAQVLQPKTADNVKGQGISFKQAPGQPEYECTRIIWGNTVEETIALNKANGIDLVLLVGEDGEPFLGIKDIWTPAKFTEDGKCIQGFHRVDRNSAVMHYGDYPATDDYVDQTWANTNQNQEGNVKDCAVVANDDGAMILEHSYLTSDGKPVDFATMKPGTKVHKSPEAIVNAVAYDEPVTLKTLEGDITTDVTMGDVDGNVYNNFKQLKKQINKGQLVANESDPNSQKFIDLVKAGKDDEAIALLKQATKESQSTQTPQAVAKSEQSGAAKNFTIRN